MRAHATILPPPPPLWLSLLALLCALWVRILARAHHLATRIARLAASARRRFARPAPVVEAEIEMADAPRTLVLVAHHEEPPPLETVRVTTRIGRAAAPTMRLGPPAPELIPHIPIPPHRGELAKDPREAVPLE